MPLDKMRKLIRFLPVIVLGVSVQSHAQVSLMDQLRDFVENGNSMIQSKPIPLKDTAELESRFNSVEWDDGKSRSFSNLRKCVVLRRRPDWYACEYAYMTISDPIRGNLFCELNRDAAGSSVYAISLLYSYNVGTTGTCRRL